jgi:hypothetical protein
MAKALTDCSFLSCFIVKYPSLWFQLSSSLYRTEMGESWGIPTTAVNEIQDTQATWNLPSVPLHPPTKPSLHSFVPWKLYHIHEVYCCKEKGKTTPQCGKMIRRHSFYFVWYKNISSSHLDSTEDNWDAWTPSYFSIQQWNLNYMWLWHSVFRFICSTCLSCTGEADTELGDWLSVDALSFAWYKDLHLGHVS